MEAAQKPRKKNSRRATVKKDREKKDSEFSYRLVRSEAVESK